MLWLEHIVTLLLSNSIRIKINNLTKAVDMNENFNILEKANSPL